MDPPTPSLPAVDPQVEQQKQLAAQDKLAALQVQAQGDTASLMARYGMRLALGGAGGTPQTGGLEPNPNAGIPGIDHLLRAL